MDNDETASPIVVEIEEGDMIRRFTGHPGVLAVLGLVLVLAGCKNGGGGGGGY